MSKSLKNFITIKEILQVTTPRVIRLFFAMHQYHKVLSYNPESSLTESTQKDKTFKDFFSLLRSLTRSIKVEVSQKWDSSDNKVFELFSEKKQRIHTHLCNNIDTGHVFVEIDELLKVVNVYAQEKPKHLLLKSIYDYLIQLFGVFGLEYEEEETAGTGSGERTVQIMDLFLKFRDSIRSNAKTDFKTILDLCDQVRDYDLVELGIRVEDKKVG